jgi:probable phosphoglycerate mutase
MLLIIARHGNTFDPGDRVVWVGARTDLPLTSKGREQAALLGSGLEPVKARIKRIVSGPLKRTSEHAGIAARILGLETPVEIDGRLREIDYGLWEGKTSEEIQALGGEAELKAWSERGAWPESPRWSPPEQAVGENVARLSHEIASSFSGDDAALLVTSNGILKFFLKLAPGAFQEMANRQALKVATGNCCALSFEEGVWQVAFWNRKPPQLFP